MNYYYCYYVLLLSIKNMSLSSVHTHHFVVYIVKIVYCLFFYYYFLAGGVAHDFYNKIRYLGSNKVEKHCDRGKRA